jgi:charged multivesicular body protein 7
LTHFTEVNSSLAVIQVVKFVDSSVALEDRVITAVDHGILELKSAIFNIQHQIDAIQIKVDK